MSDSPHDNDADTRPRIYARATSKHGEIEVTVHGAEGETASDIEDIAQRRMEDATEKQKRLEDDTPPDKGTQ